MTSAIALPSVLFLRKCNLGMLSTSVHMLLILYYFLRCEIIPI